MSNAATGRPQRRRPVDARPCRRDPEGRAHAQQPPGRDPRVRPRRGAKPPFAYKSAKTVAATAIPTAASRRSVLCSPFTLIEPRAATVTTVFGGLNRFLAAGLVAGACLVAPSAALAGCGGGPSAQNVYKECVPTGGGGKPTGGGKAHRRGKLQACKYRSRRLELDDARSVASPARPPELSATPGRTGGPSPVF